MKKIPIRQITAVQKEEASSGRFALRKVENLLQGKDLVHELHRHDFFFILALQKGNGIHEIDLTSYKVPDNSIFLLRPGQIHQLQLKAGSTGYLMEFNSGFYQPTGKASSQRLRKATNRNYYQLNGSFFEQLQSILHAIFKESVEKQEGYQDIIKANLDIFFIELVRQSRNQESATQNVSPYNQERLEDFLELLEMHSTGNKQVSYYTNLMNLSPYQLNEITKSTLGKTASEIINGHIILEAKRYLLATANQVKEIADQLGYEDVSYFIRFFKKHTGFAPDTFRNNSR